MKLSKVLKADDDTADSIANDVDLAALSAFGSQEIIDLLSDTAQKSGNQFLVEVGVPDDSSAFLQVNTRAVAYAQAHAADLVTQIDDSTRDEIRSIIADGLTDGLTYQQVSDKLEDMYSFSPERADLIARTESSIANNQGVLQGMREIKAGGSKIKKIWLPDADACDECVDNGDAGAIDLDEDFPTGDDSPPAHPNCRCDMGSEIEDESEEDDDES